MPPQMGGENDIQSPPELGDLGSIPEFMQQVYCWLANKALIRYLFL
jgi:hypothetical protein